MRRSSFGSMTAWGAALMAMFLLTPFVAAQSRHPATEIAPFDRKLLERAAKLYYSTRATGLQGFDCAVHPDWPGIFSSTRQGKPGTANDPHIALLNTVKITLHARLGGGSTLDWQVPADRSATLDASSKRMLDQMHEGLGQQFQGVMQLWTLFSNGDLVPTPEENPDLTQTGSGYRIHTEQKGEWLTELFSRELVLERFEASSGGSKLDIAPTFKPSEKGLLVNSYVAHIQPRGGPAGQTQEMHVTLSYQTVSGFPILGRVAVEMPRVGAFNFMLDGCSVRHAGK